MIKKLWSCFSAPRSRTVLSRFAVPEEKLSALDMDSIIEFLAFFVYNKGYYVVLYDIDVSAKDTKFWSKLNKEAAAKFMQDCVWMRCDDGIWQARNIRDSIEPEFAKVRIYKQGIEIQ